MLWMHTRRIPCLQQAALTAIGLMIVLTGTGCGPDHAWPDCMAGWSADGAKVALVPNFLDGDIEESGLWVQDFASGTTRRLLELPPDLYCLHPEWSPAGDEILFTIVDKDPVQDTDGNFRYSIWTIGSRGEGLRRIAEDTSPGEADWAPILLPGAVRWGAFPGTMIFQHAQGNLVTALWTDPYTGRGGAFLPAYADAYTIQPSPCRRWATALLYRNSDEHRTAEVLLSDFGYGNWRSLGVIELYCDSPEASLTRAIAWAPDSSAFVVSEVGDGDSETERLLRLFDTRTGCWTFFQADGLNASVWWDDSGSGFFYSSATGLYHVDAAKRWATRLIEGAGIRLLSLNGSNGRLYFYMEADGDTDPRRYFYSCRKDGLDLEELRSDLPPDGDFKPTVSPDGTRILTGLP
jgi:hypothetical protein